MSKPDQHQTPRHETTTTPAQKQQTEKADGEGEGAPATKGDQPATGKPPAKQ